MQWLPSMCLLAAIAFSLVSGARILAVLPFAGKSHHIFHQAIFKALAHRGHEVVVYSAIPQDKPVSNYVDVFVNSSFSSDCITYEMLYGILTSTTIDGMRGLWKEMDFFTDEALQQENIQKLFQSNEKFDLVITETFFGQEALLAFGQKFNAPSITLQSFGTFSIVNRVMGNSLSLSSIPDFNLPFSNQMSFYERLLNSYSILYTLFLFYYEHIPNQQRILDRNMKPLNMPSVAEMIHNVSLVLINTHPVLLYPQPLTPNIIPLGGIHVSMEKNPLPQHIQKFMDEAKSGVIYLSLGSIVPDHLMPKEYFDNFVKVFKKLPQRVLWKTRNNQISGLPNNVMTEKWVPQQDVLAHPNCVLFMTHGGLLSLLEAVYAGVPVTGTPFYGDQPMNVYYYEQAGIGVKLDFLTLSEHSISRAISKVLSNPQYKENAKRLSRIYKDLPTSQANTAVFWVEYVLRHRGASHLRPASIQLTWYQLGLLDVLAAVLAAIMAVLAILYLICKTVLYFLCGTRRTDYTSKKKN